MKLFIKTLTDWVIARKYEPGYTGPLYEPLPIPQKKDADSGFDLYVVEDTWLFPCFPKLIKHNIAVALPEGHEGQLRPRSSTLLKRGIHVALGTIDNGYRGALGTCVVRVLPWPTKVKRGERLSQLVVAPVASPQIVMTMDLDSTDRGDAGWGSSGK